MFTKSHREVSQSHFDVIQGQYEGHVESLWWSIKIIVKVTQSQCEDTQTFLGGGHKNYVKTQSFLGHTYVMSHIVIWGQIEMFWMSQYVIVNITQNLCEGLMESSWMSHSHYEGTQVMVRVFKIIVKVTLSLWDGISRYCVSWKDNMRSPKVIVMVTQWLWDSLRILVDAQQVTGRTYNIIVKFMQSPCNCHTVIVVSNIVIMKVYKSLWEYSKSV